MALTGHKRKISGSLMMLEWISVLCLHSCSFINQFSHNVGKMPWALWGRGDEGGTVPAQGPPAPGPA